MELTDIVRTEVDIKEWKHAPDLVERVLVRLNHFHKYAVQKVVDLGNQIKEAGGKPLIEVSIRWPSGDVWPPLPEPEPIP